MVAAHPPWVMLEHYCTREDQGCCASIADTNTRASCLTTGGLPINVSLCLAAPPEGSRVCVQLPAGLEVSDSIVLAAHGDSVLVEIAEIQGRRRSLTTEHFVYNAGNAAVDPPRPPSLSLLPLYDLIITKGGHVCNFLNSSGATGLLRHSEDEFVVAELHIGNASDDDALVGQETPMAAELHLLRSAGHGKWSARRPAIRHYHGGLGGELLSSWRSDAVIPIGDRLCWVDLSCGLMFSDVSVESPELCYVPLPEDPFFGQTMYRNVSVTASGAVIKFVNIFPRCCCGGVGSSYCQHSRDAYIVNTWTLTMHDMAWVMDGTIDATELWPLDGFNGLPRVVPDYPIVSLDEPHCICFEVCENHHFRDGDKMIWRVMVDMRRKTLRSVFRYPEGRKYIDRNLLFPSRVSECFNSKPSNGMQAPSQVETVPNLVKNITNDLGHTACETSNTAPPIQASSLAKILAALKVIPDLDRDDMLKAFRILQTSVGLPKGFEEGLCSDGEQCQ